MHVPEEERKQQSANMRPVHIGIGHQNHFAVAQFQRIKIIFANARPQRGDHGSYFLVTQHLVVTGLFHIQYLALQRQNRLETPVSALLGGSACGFTLDQEKLTAVGIAFRAIRQLAWKPTAIQCAFATGQVARLARCLTCPGGFNRLVDDLARHRRVLLEERA